LRKVANSGKFWTHPESQVAAADPQGKLISIIATC
jgi:hypothetical protein